MAVIAAVLTGLVLAAPVLWLQIDEAGVPPLSDARLPDGVTVRHEEIRCGSGGCWRELSLDGLPGDSSEERAASIGHPHETCRARSLIDRRRVCSFVTVVGQRIRLHLRYDRSRWF